MTEDYTIFPADGERICIMHMTTISFFIGFQCSMIHCAIIVQEPIVYGIKNGQNDDELGITTRNTIITMGDPSQTGEPK